jgi:hypothetical protein
MLCLLSPEMHSGRPFNKEIFRENIQGGLFKRPSRLMFAALNL